MIDPEDGTLAFLHRLGLALMMGRLVVLLPPYLIKGLSSRLEDQDANHMLIKLKKESFSGFQRSDSEALPIRRIGLPYSTGATRQSDFSHYRDDYLLPYLRT